MRKVGIVAACHREAMYRIEELWISAPETARRRVGNNWFINGVEYFIVVHPWKLRGIRNWTLEYTGNWFTRKDLPDIRDMEHIEQMRQGSQEGI